MQFSKKLVSSSIRSSKVKNSGRKVKNVKFRTSSKVNKMKLLTCVLQKILSQYQKSPQSPLKIEKGHQMSKIAKQKRQKGQISNYIKSIEKNTSKWSSSCERSKNLKVIEGQASWKKAKRGKFRSQNVFKYVSRSKFFTIKHTKSYFLSLLRYHFLKIQEQIGKFKG